MTLMLGCRPGGQQLPRLRQESGIPYLAKDRCISRPRGESIARRPGTLSTRQRHTYLKSLSRIRAGAGCLDEIGPGSSASGDASAATKPNPVMKRDTLGPWSILSAWLLAARCAPVSLDFPVGPSRKLSPAP